jgi:hypothetical protein
VRQHIGAPLPPVYRADYERSVAAARAHIGEMPFAAAWAQGRTMTPKQALAAEDQLLLLPSTPSPKPAATYPDGLTPREMDVLVLLAQGLTSTQIAEQLVIGVVTVNFHALDLWQAGSHLRSRRPGMLWTITWCEPSPFLPCALPGSARLTTTAHASACSFPVRASPSILTGHPRQHVPSCLRETLSSYGVFSTTTRYTYEQKG